MPPLANRHIHLSDGTRPPTRSAECPLRANSGLRFEPTRRAPLQCGHSRLSTWVALTSAVGRPELPACARLKRPKKVTRSNRDACDAGRHRSNGVSLAVAGPSPGWRSDAGERPSLSFEEGSRMSWQFTVGLSVQGKADRIVVLAEDALVAALKVKAERPQATIMYVRRLNRRGDTRHPPHTLTGGRNESRSAPG